MAIVYANKAIPGDLGSSRFRNWVGIGGGPRNYEIYEVSFGGRNFHDLQHQWIPWPLTQLMITLKRVTVSDPDTYEPSRRFNVLRLT